MASCVALGGIKVCDAKLNRGTNCGDVTLIVGGINVALSTHEPHAHAIDRQFEAIGESFCRDVHASMIANLLCRILSTWHYTKTQRHSLADFTPLGKKQKVESLEIIDLVEGIGAVVPADATITAHYTGALCTDGTILKAASTAVDQPRLGCTR